MIPVSLRFKLVAALGWLTLVTAQQAHGQFRNQNDWVSMWALNGRTEDQVAKQFRSDSKMRIQNMDRICDLNEQQQQKLKLAADADVTRFMRECSRIRLKLKDMNDRQQQRPGSLGSC